MLHTTAGLNRDCIAHKVYNSYHLLLYRENLPALDLAHWSWVNKSEGDWSTPELRSRVVKTQLSSFWRREAIKGPWSAQRIGFLKPRVWAVAEPQMGRLPDCFASLYRRKGDNKKDGCLGHVAQSMLAGTRNNGSSALWDWGVGASPTPQGFPVSLYCPKEGEEGN